MWGRTDTITDGEAVLQLPRLYSLFCLYYEPLLLNL